MRIFFTPRQSVKDNESFSPSAGKPAAFVEAALRRFPGLDRVAGKSDLILYQAGADPHVDDPLGGLLSSD